MSDIAQRFAESPAQKIASSIGRQEDFINQLNPCGGVIDSINKHNETIGN